MINSRNGYNNNDYNMHMYEKKNKKKLATTSIFK